MRWWLLPVAVLCRIGQASAGEDPDELGVSVTDCPASAVSRDRLLELVRTEVAPRRVVPSESVKSGLLVEITLCTGSPDGAHVTYAKDGRTLAERGVDLSDVTGDSRARTLAMAVAELVAKREAPAEPLAESTVPAPPLAPRPTEPPPPNVPTRSIPRPDAGLLIGAGAAVRGHFNPATPLAGAWLAVGTERVYGEALVLTSNHEVSLGAVTTSSAVGAVGLDLLSLARRPAVSLRLRAELGVSWATAKPANETVHRIPKTAPQAAGAAECSLRPRLFGNVLGELRAVAGVARGLMPAAAGKAVSSTDGFFAGVTLGVFYGVPSNP
jgi:hypothetical protein